MATVNHEISVALNVHKKTPRLHILTFCECQSDFLVIKAIRLIFHDLAHNHNI
jgi:hypothetical protein